MGGFAQADHIDDLFLNMGYFFHTDVLGGQHGPPDDHIGKSDLAGPAAVHAVGLCKPGHHPAGILGFPAEEHPFPGDEDIVKDHRRGFALAIDGVSQLFGLVAEHLPLG